uniref:Uncharacterized protein n=1 Tax=Clytia hemisphaerica TaxID=252671 RepID=A0A7M5X0Y6_9CNID
MKSMLVITLLLIGASLSSVIGQLRPQPRVINVNDIDLPAGICEDNFCAGKAEGGHVLFDGSLVVECGPNCNVLGCFICAIPESSSTYFITANPTACGPL